MVGPTDGQTMAAAAADMNGDGHIDVYFCSAYRNLLFLGDGTGTFVSDTSTALYEYLSCVDVDVVDITGDGHLDVYITRQGSGLNNAMYSGDGAGAFTRVTTGPQVSSAFRSTTTLVADLNGDTLLDLYVANTETQENQVYIASYCSAPGYRAGPGNNRLCFACPNYALATLLGTEGVCDFCAAGKMGPPGLVPLAPAETFLCLACEPGKYRAQTDRVDVCTECTAGLFALGGQSACSQCEVGRVPNLWAESAAADRNGASSCVACASGTAPNTARSACNACTGATYSDTGFECRVCDVGVVNSAKTTCSPCAAGNGPNSDSTACEACTGSTYSTTGICLDCNPGRVPGRAPDDHSLGPVVGASFCEAVKKTQFENPARCAIL